jgi:CTP synthase
MKAYKYIFVIGGVMSGVGKGITTSSIGTIIQAKGFKVNLIKADPYLNVDAGTMNPTEHGEVFVLDSGLETDQDMGNYERFLNQDLSHDDYMTSGMVYQTVIERERNLGYKGKCVEAIPHITNEITDRIKRSADKAKADITIVEIGGTIGDYQNVLFMEAARVLKVKQPRDVTFVMVSYMPIPGTIGEMKSKPTQNAVRQLNSYGIHPEFIIARAEVPLDKKRKEKIAISCSIEPEHVISAPDIESVYDVPLNFERDKIGEMLLKALCLKVKKNSKGLGEWTNFVKKVKNPLRKPVSIAIVGKYFNTGDFVLSDVYVSVIDAVKFSSYHLGVKPELTWLVAQDFENDTKIIKELSTYNGVIVPGGFGESGIAGKLNVIRYCRENKIPYFGLCYGMQLMVIEYARNVIGLKDANTTEIDPMSKNPIIDIMLDQKKHIAEGRYGASMRLGAYECALKKGSVAREAYGRDTISERHRHRYEVNNAYLEAFEAAGLDFSGTSPDGKLMEIAELPRSIHPFYLGTQFHPEFKARPLAPHPLFTAFIKASLGVSLKDNKK